MLSGANLILKNDLRFYKVGRGNMKSKPAFASDPFYVALKI